MRQRRANWLAQARVPKPREACLAQFHEARAILVEMRFPTFGTEFAAAEFPVVIWLVMKQCAVVEAEVQLIPCRKPGLDRQPVVPRCKCPLFAGFDIPHQPVVLDVDSDKALAVRA